MTTTPKPTTTPDEHDGYSEYTELGGDPAQPSANKICLYAKDDGGGISRLFYIDDAGGVHGPL